MPHATLKIATAFMLGVLLAGGISFAFAQSLNGPNDPQQPSMNMNMHGRMAHGFAGSFHRRWHGFMPGPAGAAIADLNGIQRLYMLQGRRKDIAGLYRYVLSKTQDPQLRNYAYRHLARAELQVTNADQAIATLRQNLDENLTQLNQAASNKQ